MKLVHRRQIVDREVVGILAGLPQRVQDAVEQAIGTVMLGDGVSHGWVSPGSE